MTCVPIFWISSHLNTSSRSESGHAIRFRCVWVRVWTQLFILLLHVDQQTMMSWASETIGSLLCVRFRIGFQLVAVGFKILSNPRIIKDRLRSLVLYIKQDFHCCFHRCVGSFRVSRIFRPRKQEKSKSIVFAVVWHLFHFNPEDYYGRAWQPAHTVACRAFLSKFAINVIFRVVSVLVSLVWMSITQLKSQSFHSYTICVCVKCQVDVTFWISHDAIITTN